MEQVKTFFNTQLFAIDGFKLTVGVVVLIVLIWYFFLRK